MKANEGTYHGYLFPPDISSQGVWLYYRFCLSFRDVEELLAKRGILVSYEAIRQSCRKFGPKYARKLKCCAGKAQRFLSVHGVIRNLFRLGRHELRVEDYPPPRARSFKEWSAATAA